MEFAQLIRERYSVRRFTAEPVTDAELQSILEAARLAPTAVNKQPQRLLVLRSVCRVFNQLGNSENRRKLLHIWSQDIMIYVHESTVRKIRDGGFFFVHHIQDRKSNV